MTRHYKPGPTEPDRIPNSSVVSDTERSRKEAHEPDIRELQRLNASMWTLAALVAAYRAALDAPRRRIR